MKDYIKKVNLEDLFTILFTIAFIFHLNVSTISNYYNSSIILKIVSTIVITGFAITHSILYNNDLKKTFIKYGSSGLYIILLLLLSIPALSIIYSFNKSFGGLKILLLALNTLPTILVFYYFYKTYTVREFRVFLNTTVTIAILTSAYVLIVTPYNYNGSYEIGLFQWSHVISGRFLGSAILIISLAIIYRNKLSQSLVAGFVITSAGLITTQFRAGVLCLFIVLILLLISTIKANNRKNKTIRTTGLLVIILFVLIVFDIVKKNTRYESLVKDMASVNYSDSSISARESAYRYGFESILKRPLLGAGVGGFYSKEIGKEVNRIKYTHNIILEVGVEYGIPVAILFIVILIIVSKRQYKFHPAVMWFFIYTFLLGLFSKDLPNQPILLMGLIFWDDFKEGVKEFHNKH